MQPTKQQWDEIAKELDRQFAAVYLRCDGYVVSAQMLRVNPNRLAIVVVVNGWQFKGVWLPSYRDDDPREMSEEARRFWMPRKKAKVRKKELKLYEKIYGKRECRRRGYYDTYLWPTPTWNRPMPFIRHLKKHNQHIEIIDADTYRRELEALRAQEQSDD